ncbi:MAG: DUF3667 domain-containing protein [Bacteroidia bacterium]|nr:DUF3667 domain-containing protein [Bacteroidia bacterium]
MARRKLKPPAGTLCRNCHSPLVGPYCHTCGQEHTQRPIFLRQLVQEGIEELFDWDSKLLRSLRPLFFRPAFLTREFVAGRRVRYVAPVRFYVLASLLFFFVFDPTLDKDAIQTETAPAAAGVDSTKGTAATDLEHAARTGRPLSDTTRADTTHPRARKDNPDNDLFINLVGGEDTSSFIGRLQARANQRIEAEGPTVFLNYTLDRLPTAIILMLPLVALLLALVYIRQRRDYLEHLIFTLHVHTFAFTLTVALYGLVWATERYLGWRDPEGLYGFLGLVPLYLFVALRRYYGQGFWKTTFKFAFLGFAYLSVTVVAMAGLLTVSMYLYANG